MCPNNCSNHGSCNYTTGVCSCERGYVDADCGGIISPSTEKIHFQITTAVRKLCYLDIFTAVVDIEHLPSNLATLFTYGIKYAGNLSYAQSSGMIATSQTWSFTAASTLVPGEYVFEIFAVDPLMRPVVLNYDVKQTWSFTVQSSPVAPVSIISNAMTTTRSIGAQVFGTLGTTACMASNATVVWSWSLNDTTTRLDLIAAKGEIFKQSPLLDIPPDILVPGRSYVAELQAYYAGYQVESMAAAQVNIDTSFSTIDVRIVEGSRALGRPQALTYHAVATDSDGTADGRLLTYSWRIVAAGSTTDLIALAVQPTDTATLNVPANSFDAGLTYDISCTVSKLNTTSAVATVSVTVYVSEVPTVSIAGEEDFQAAKVDPSKSILLFGTATISVTASLQQPSIFAWSILPFIDIPANVLPNSLTSNTTLDVALKGKVLAENQRYTFKLQAKVPAINDWGFSTYSIRTNIAPVGGSFDAIPISSPIISMNTNVRFSATGWQDLSDNVPLQYQFGYYFPATQSEVYVLQDFSSLASVTTAYLPVGVVRPILKIKNVYGLVLTVKLGCHAYAPGGTYATAIDCPNVQDLVVSAISSSVTQAITNQLSTFVPSRHSGIEILAFAKAAATGINADTTARPADGLAIRISLNDLVKQAQARGDTILPAQVASNLQAIMAKPHLVQDSSLLSSIGSNLEGLINNTASRLDTDASTSLLATILGVMLADNAEGLIDRAGQAVAGLIAKLSAMVLADINVNNPPITLLTTIATLNGIHQMQLTAQKATKAVLSGSTISNTMASLKLPTGDIFAKSSLSGSRRLLTSMVDVFQVVLSYIPPAANPYTSAPFNITLSPLRSGIVGVSFATAAGAPLTISGLTYAESLLVDVTLTSPSNSPKCVYRGSSGWVDSGVSTEGLLPQIKQSAAGSTITCRTTHATDFAVLDSCAAATTCSGHGICRHDGSCQCICGYYGANCSTVHVATWATPTKSRYVSNAAGARLVIGNNGAGGFVALIPYAGSTTCSGAGSAGVGSYSTGLGIRLAVSWSPSEQAGLAYLPYASNTPVPQGKYTICFCNAEKQNDPVYSNCNKDCAFHTNGDVLTVMGMPRLGPILDPGPVCALVGSVATFRIRGSNLTTYAVKQADHVFVAPNCQAGPVSVATAAATPKLNLSSVESMYHSAMFELPRTLSSNGLLANHLKVCYAPFEMGDAPHLADYAELSDSLTVVPLPVFNNGVDGRMIQGSAPDFVITPNGSTVGLVDGGDKLYFRSDCTSLGSASTDSTGILSVTEYDNDVIGPNCSSATAIAVVDPVFSSPYSDIKLCGLDSAAALHSPTAWCGIIHSSTLSKLQVNDPIRYAQALVSNDGVYLQVDLKVDAVIGTVVTQGRADANAWVTQFSVAWSKDGVVWQNIMHQSSLHLFNGNFDRNSLLYNDLPGTVVGRYLRIYPKSWYGNIGMRIGVLVCHIGYKVRLPTLPPLWTEQQLQVCYATRRSEGDALGDYLPLANTLKVVKDPQPSSIYAKQAEITGLTFGETGVAKAGDYVVVQRYGCDAVLSNPAFPHGPTPVMVLEVGGIVSLAAVLNARLNELVAGTYSICLATSESGGDYEKDFHTTVGRFVIEALRFNPVMRLPRTVPLGENIFIHWTAGSGRVAHPQDWIGLFDAGACPQLQLHDEDIFPADIDSTAPLEQNRCYKAWKALPSGEVSGSIQFSAAEYDLKAGKYEARYFQGDSRNGQGIVCRRLQGSPDELYEYCALESLKVSDVVEVVAPFAAGTYEYENQEDKMPGLEVMVDMGTAWQTS